jgi:hypothetical protein
MNCSHAVMLQLGPSSIRIIRDTTDRIKESSVSN